jgi:hypothetical protein
LQPLRLSAAKNRKPNAVTEEDKQNENAFTLETRLGKAAEAFTKDSVRLSFTVINTADTVQRFCKWETPFEPKLGKYLDIKDTQGNEAPFMGAMARRTMPPPAESYIEVSAHDSVRTVFNLAKNYTVAPGEYSVKYIGGGVSGLQAGNEIKITVK